MHLMFITFTRTHFWTSRNWPDPPKYRWHSVLGSCSSSSLSIKRQCPSFPCHGTQVPSLSVPCLMSVLQAPVVISRDHHDVSGTDSPFRETSNIYDGSAFTAGILGSPKCIISFDYTAHILIDMAVQNCIGDAFRGATWVALHNGGGCGW